MTAEQIIQAVRALAKTACSLTDAQVLVGDSAGTEPAGTGAFLSVRLISNQPVMVQTVVVPVSGSMYKRVSAQKRARISVTGIGYQSEAWVELLQTIWHTTHPAVDTMRAAGLTPGEATDVRNTTRIDRGFPSPSFGVDLIGYHRVILSDAAVTSVDTINVSQTLGGATITYTAVEP